MGIKRNETALNWSYFLALESDLEQLSRYVDLSANEDTFSLEIARLFLSCSSEVEVALKQLCKIYSPNSTPNRINEYHDIILNNTKDFIGFEVTIPKFGVTLTPWIDWTDENSPLWWRAHNKVKHERHQHFEKANLKHCLNAIAALFVTTLYLSTARKVEDDELPIPRLLSVSDHHFIGAYMGRFGPHNAYQFE